ncbi:MAG: 1-deoxy-D-xylulose-5-phosphate synthase [Spirochaetaceae bacterium]|nr:1-deoxy-D-xylulose-5-phosphate synthase [Spirochaetaceae bacterium]
MSGNESLLGQIKSPRDLSSLNLSDLTKLCAEIRRIIIETVAKNGGHLSSNLGVVELSVALHAVFDSPKDTIVWDVGHQCYAHKLLTGRFSRFSTLRQQGGIAGFPRRLESEHDSFDTGHASTSISVALGFLEAETLSGGTGRCIALIGDGALTGGLAYEALSNAGQLRLPLIVLLNDNRMSISPNVGGLSKHLSRLSMTRKYQIFRVTFDSLVQKIPLIGNWLNRAVRRLKRAVKAVFYHDNFFVDLGFEYVGPIDGHNLAELLGVLNNVRKLERPVVVHIITQKGRGYEAAEKDPGAFHSVPPFSSDEGKVPASGASWTRAFGEALVAAARRNDKILAVSAAMARGAGLSRFNAEFPRRFYDVGIAEAHAVSFAAALAARGFRPVVAIYSTFIQRAVDSIIHDTAIGKLPVVFILDRAGFVGADGETHQGLFDIALFRAVPEMTLLAPADAGELSLMLDWALALPSPCAIRYPKAPLPEPHPAFAVPLELGRGVLLKGGGCGGEAGEKSALCLAFTGSLYPQALRAAELLAESGISCDLYNLRFLKPLDEDYLAALVSGYQHFYIIEEGCRCGGVGECIADLLLGKKLSGKIRTLNAGDQFYAVGTREELLSLAGLDGEGIARCALGAFSPC